MSGGISRLAHFMLTKRSAKQNVRHLSLILHTSSFKLERIKMIKTILTMVVTAIAGLVGYLVSDTYRERQAQKQRD